MILRIQILRIPERLFADYSCAHKSGFLLYMSGMKLV
jgi:hypothetical protein